MAKRSKLREPEIGTCTFCGQVKEITRDHVPPDNLWPSPQPSNLITVPSCLDCNRGASKDDEYFKTMLVMRADIAEHPEAKRLLPGIHRAFLRPQQARLTNAIIRSMNSRHSFTPSGLYAGKIYTYDIDLDRMQRIAGRIILGLFYHETRSRLADNYLVSVRVLSPLVELGLHLAIQQQQWIDFIKSTMPQKTIGDGVFSYWFYQNPKVPNRTVWLLTFYEKVQFIGCTVKDARKKTKRPSKTQ